TLKTSHISETATLRFSLRIPSNFSCLSSANILPLSFLQLVTRAAALVEDGDIIVLDTGTTTLHIARNIRDRQNVTVVTNDYQI
ncbi:hypothetical protein ACSLO7_30285, partial [Klebsiella pneumoniae]